MKYELNKATLDEIVAAVVSRKYIYGAAFYVSSDDNCIDLISATGNMNEDSQYYIASINKFFISAIILKLCTENKLGLQDKIAKYLPEKVVRELHIHKGKDYSKNLTIAQLISLSSGLPCYLTDKQANGKRAMAELEAGIDQPWPIDKVLQEVKKMKTHFPPGEKGRARYGDTNHQILSLIIENITGDRVNAVLKKLFQDLNLTNTFVFEENNEKRMVPIFYKSEPIKIPLFLSSTQNDIVSTVKDQMTFLRAFFSGNFFPKERLKEYEKWNNIFFPFKYGIGIQKFCLPMIFSSFRPVPDMIGHCGSTGSVAFYIPDRNLYITGTTNQQAKPSIAFQAMIKIVRALRESNIFNTWKIRT
ncbi:beta-lactamase family protein [bacterium]|nr:beta-lactamase family protein [bacterium]MBU1636247.1 beta-lactamase family protein [bacterium]